MISVEETRAVLGNFVITDTGAYPCVGKVTPGSKVLIIQTNGMKQAVRVRPRNKILQG